MQSKRAILLRKRKILGKYFQGSWSYLKWIGFPLRPLPSILYKHKQRALANTHLHSGHTKLCWRHRCVHKPLFFRRNPELISAAPLPPDQLTRLFIFPMPTLNSNISLQMKRPVCACPGGQKKLGKYQQVFIYIRTKTNKSRRKELLRRSKAFFFFFAPEILLMWLQAACQPNLIWIYIQRKCLV